MKALRDLNANERLYQLYNNQIQEKLLYFYYQEIPRELKIFTKISWNFTQMPTL